MMKSRIAALLLGSLLVSGSAFAADTTIKPTRGTIDSVSDSAVQITTRQGDKLDVKITDQTKVNSISKAKISDIKADSFIGTAAVPMANGELKALEVHVFAPSLRGSGEGFNPFESPDGKINTMTNGTVGKLVNSNGRTMTVKYGDKQKTVQVPDDVPVVLIEPGNKSLLKPGGKVVLFGSKASDGHIVARGISAGKDGLTPPM